MTKRLSRDIAPVPKREPKIREPSKSKPKPKPSPRNSKEKSSHSSRSRKKKLRIPSDGVSSGGKRASHLDVNQINEQSEQKEKFLETIGEELKS